MQAITRRRFLGQGGLAAGAALVACGTPGAARANPIEMPVGVQTYIVRDTIGQDFAGTLRRLAGMGFQSIEMCSPHGYGKSWESLTKLTATQMRETIGAAGLSCESCHYPFVELQEHLDERVAYAQELGLTQMVVSGFWLKKDATLDDWRKSAEACNRLGERTRNAGIQLAFHNHHFEFAQIDGTLIYDELMERLDPDLVKMQFQVAVINIGYKAVTYFRKYPGRFISLHLADYSAEKKQAVPIGQGVVDWDELFSEANAAGVKNYFVEMGAELLTPSAAYLHNLTV
ncbi:Inosose dehydratase [Planctomycetes bacterium CA13]|uniref:Inosose dehydratase n=1 Tax=Novipirellula herctigrandis TaxID=2527986 RepID=A0A5C5YYT0_9BACT|nr:Inosose dehydratase [Planctomycetes bacterium CA13]